MTSSRSLSPRRWIGLIAVTLCLQMASVALAGSAVGWVTDADGSGGQSIKMVFSIVRGSGNTPNYVISDVRGAWAAGGFTPGTIYRITPTNQAGQNHTFDPACREATAVNGELTGLDFRIASSWSISGYVKTTDGRGLAGVPVLGATTDSGGFYCRAGLAAGTWQAVPSRNGYTFSPASQSITIGPNRAGLNFTATAVPVPAPQPVPPAPVPVSPPQPVPVPPIVPPAGAPGVPLGFVLLPLAGDPAHGLAQAQILRQGDRTVFYFDVPNGQTGTYSVWTELNGTLADSVLAYSSDSTFPAASLTIVNDDCSVRGCSLNHARRHSRIDQRLEAGRRYYLRVTGFNGTAGIYVLHVQRQGAPVAVAMVPQPVLPVQPPWQQSGPPADDDGAVLRQPTAPVEGVLSGNGSATTPPQSAANTNNNAGDGQRTYTLPSMPGVPGVLVETARAAGTSSNTYFFVRVTNGAATTSSVKVTLYLSGQTLRQVKTADDMDPSTTGETIGFLWDGVTTAASWASYFVGGGGVAISVAKGIIDSIGVFGTINDTVQLIGDVSERLSWHRGSQQYTISTSGTREMFIWTHGTQPLAVSYAATVTPPPRNETITSTTIGPVPLPLNEGEFGDAARKAVANGASR